MQKYKESYILTRSHWVVTNSYFSIFSTNFGFMWMWFHIYTAECVFLFVNCMLCVTECLRTLRKIFPGQQFHTRQASVSLISKLGMMGHPRSRKLIQKLNDMRDSIVRHCNSYQAISSMKIKYIYIYIWCRDRTLASQSVGKLYTTQLHCAAWHLITL